jgi:hypothetical protein
MLAIFLKKSYFCLLNFDLSIFTNNFTIIAIYIDNLLIIDVNRKFIDAIKRALTSRFKIVNLDFVR